MPSDAAFWTKDNGEVVDLAYVRSRASAELSKWRNIYSLERRRQIVNETVGSEAWMRPRMGCTVGSVLREVVDRLFASGRDELRPEVWGSSGPFPGKD